MKQAFLYTNLFLLISSLAMAQETKNVVDQQINITKEKEVDIQKANKVLNKGQVIPNNNKDKKITYTFFEKKPKASTDIKFDPKVLDPSQSSSEVEDEKEAFNNHIKLGAGSFGRILGEVDINSPQDQDFIYGISAFHNSTRRGPIRDDLSSLSETKIQLDGKYHRPSFELKANASYENRGYYFYGIDTNEVTIDYTKRDLRQRVNIFGFNIGFENTKPKPIVDYTVKTGITYLDDYYSASELDWASTASIYFPILGKKVIATVAGEAYITERTDNFDTEKTRKRNLFRVEPGFNFEFGRFSAKAGFKAVNEYDQILNINQTKGFPTAMVSYRTPDLTYFYIGYDGDIIRNTLRSSFNENPFLTEQIDLQNTYKNMDIYAGIRGELYTGLIFNAKISYGKYQNMYYYTIYEGLTYNKDRQPINTSKYQIEYEGADVKTDFINTNLEVAYNIFDYWKSNLRFDYNYYETSEKFEQPFHRPAFNTRFGNVFTISERMIATLDFYHWGRIYGKDPVSLQTVKLKDIVDLNVDISYLFTPKFTGFVKINNIVGQNYQKYYLYPQLGLNFVAGVNFSF
ncbi:MAG: hypothetical protein ACRCVT_15345 [Leadbetterella sp.]